MRPDRLGTYLDFLYAMLLSWSAASCITMDLDECPNVYQTSFSYEMNPLGIDAFRSQVPSVSLYAFDAETGRFVCSSSGYGSPLGEENYRMSLDLSPGTYDLVAWAGVYGNDGFVSLPACPEAIGELSLELDHDGECSRLLSPVYHGKRRVTFTDNNLTGSSDPQVAGIPLVKNTNRLNVRLIRLGESPVISADDFHVSLMSENSCMGYDNSVSGSVIYRPWSVKISSPGVHLSELSTTRLMADAHSRLEVVRASDGESIISIPLEDNLLQYRKEFYSAMDEQEYLDRMDEFDVTFVLTESNTWNTAADIYINKWAVAPIQYVDW